MNKKESTIGKNIASLGYNQSLMLANGERNEQNGERLIRMNKGPENSPEITSIGRETKSN